MKIKLKIVSKFTHPSKISFVTDSAVKTALPLFYVPNDPES
jgi:hypothetical protein